MQKKNNKNKNKNKNKIKNIKKSASASYPVEQAIVSSAVTRVNVSRDPVIRNMAKGCLICRREFIRDIGGSDAYTSDSTKINPGNPDLFPWLSGIATNYESYEPKRLRFIFETTSATTRGGSVILGIDYDPEDSPPPIKSDLLAYYGAKRSAPWYGFSIDMDLKRLAEKTFYTRSHSEPDNIKLYDLGSLVVGREGTGTGYLGELWVEYEFQLIHPQRSELDYPAWAAISANPGGPGAPWGTGTLMYGNLGVSQGATSTYTINIHKAGSYIFMIYAAGIFTTDATAAYSSDGAHIIRTNAFWNSAVAYAVFGIQTLRAGNYFSIDFRPSASTLGRVDSWLVPCDYDTADRSHPSPT